MSSGPSPRVLVVDDNRAFAENLAEILGDAGYEARIAGSVAEARQEARRGFEVALVDVRLPDGDGSSLAAELKEKVPFVEVVLLTGYATLESAADAVRAGACAYLLKPCATPELLLTLEQAMRQVRLQQEKAELARRAQTAEKLAAVGTLTAGLSHEIRNPLNAAGLQLEVLARRIGKLPQAQQAGLLEPLGLAREEIRRLDHILEDFLQFARPARFTPHPVALAELLHQKVALYSEDAGRRGVELVCECQEVPEVLGDEERLQQVLVNLLLNALDATPAGGRVTVGCGPRGSSVAFWVEDTGPGISEEQKARILEPFFTTKPTGSGLGLAIVHAIVQQHEGSLEIERAKEGGARMVVILPSARLQAAR